MDTDRPPRAALIPVKSFDVAKGRLADALTGPERAELARSMAAGVVSAARPLPTFVVCGTGEVARWAEGQGATVIWFEPPGLNPAVSHAADVLAADGFEHLVVIHGDLPLATSIAPVVDFDGVTIVPDRRGEGTNVMGLPLATGFRFQYGEGSAPLHRAEAERLELPVRTVTDSALGLDIDVPADLDLLRDRAVAPIPAVGGSKTTGPTPTGPAPTNTAEPQPGWVDQTDGDTGSP